MNRPIIHHGTPLTPRVALEAIMPGRAACVSFARPDDVEAVEAVCPRIMFRQRRVQLLAGRHEARRGMGRCASELFALLPLAGASPPGRSLGGDPGSARGAKPAQRRAARRLAIRANLWRSALAHGRPDPAPRAAVRAIRHGGPRLDRRSEEGARGLRPLSAPHGRGLDSVRQHLAIHPHDAWGCGGVRLSIHRRRCDQPRAERASL